MKDNNESHKARKIITRNTYINKYLIFCISISLFELQGSEVENKLLQRNSVIVDDQSNEIMIITTTTIRIMMKIKDNDPSHQHHQYVNGQVC